MLGEGDEDLEQVELCILLGEGQVLLTMSLQYSVWEVVEVRQQAS